MRSFLRILPDGVLGMEATNATLRILLYGATYKAHIHILNFHLTTTKDKFCLQINKNKIKFSLIF